MIEPIRSVAVSGSLSAPSRSSRLALLLLRALEAQAQVEPHLVEIGQLGPLLGHGLGRMGLPAAARAALELVESADLLVAATPVYRGSYSGLFKHFFDLVDQDALQDVPVILAASAGSARHALMLEHALRPLFSCFRAQSVPMAIFACGSELQEDGGASPELSARAAQAARQAIRLLQRRPRLDLSQPSSHIGEVLSRALASRGESRETE
jgi:FMN reductase